MLANGIKQTTATTGAGNVILIAASGYPKLSDVFALNTQTAYTLLDSGGLFIESGFGYLSDASTFVRARVSATFAGGTYNSVNPTAANLSGTTTIICTPHANTLESMMPTVDTVSASLNRLLTSAARTATTSTVSIYAGDVHYIPFLLRAGAPIAALGVNVVTPGSSGAIIRAGLYSLNEKGYIGNQLAATGNLDGGTTGLKIGPLASALNLPAGWYFTSITINAGSAGVTAYSSSGNNELGGSPLGFNTASPPVQIDFRTEAGGTVGVLPAVPSVTTTAHPVGQTHVPLVFLGV